MELRKNLYELIDSIGDLGEINIACTFLKAGKLEKWVLKKCIYNYCGLSSRIPMADALIEILISLRLVDIKKRRKGELIYLSRLGLEFSQLKYKEIDRLTQEQGIFLLMRAIKNSFILNDIFSVLTKLNKNNNGELWINKQDKRIGILEDRILRLLQQLKIARYNDDIVSIGIDEKEYLTNILFARYELNEEYFLELLEQKRHNGKIAEEFVESFEKDRLVNLGRNDLAQFVKKITSQNIAAGYDILSFDGKGLEISPNRFIEVKGNSGEQVLFYVSRNEFSTAKRLSGKYWIYCVLNVNFPNSRKIFMIKDPYKNVFQSKKYKVEPVLWRCSYK